MHAAGVGHRAPRGGRFRTFRTYRGRPGLRFSPVSRQAGTVVPLPLVHPKSVTGPRPNRNGWSRSLGRGRGVFLARAEESLLHTLLMTKPLLGGGVRGCPQKLYTGCAQGCAQLRGRCPQVVPRLVHRRGWAGGTRLRRVWSGPGPGGGFPSGRVTTGVPRPGDGRGSGNVIPGLFDHGGRFRRPRHRLRSLPAGK